MSIEAYVIGVVGGIQIKVPSGLSDERGCVELQVPESVVGNSSIAPADARRFAKYLLDAAEVAERQSSR